MPALADVSDDDYESLCPIQWPVPVGRPQGTARLFGDGCFFADGGTAKFVARSHRPPASELSKGYSFALNTGRVRDHWHTMTRTGLSPRLSEHIAEPFVEIHPVDAKLVGLEEASLATVQSLRGTIIVRVLITDRQAQGGVFVPMHWTPPYASCADVNTLVGGNVDPVSGQPELKYTPVKVVPFQAAWHGFCVSTKKPNLEEFDYWAAARVSNGWRVEVADKVKPVSFEFLAKKLLGTKAVSGEGVIALSDNAIATHSFAHFFGEGLEGAFFVSLEPVEVARSWLVEQLNQLHHAKNRYRILVARAPKDQPDHGAIICSCFQIGVNQIAAAVIAGAASVDAVGAKLKAGTNCGSCRAEIHGLVLNFRAQQAI